MPARTAVSLSLDADLVSEMEALDIDLSEAVENALRGRLREERVQRWRTENAEAIRLSNEELNANGLWSDEYRLF